MTNLSIAIREARGTESQQAFATRIGAQMDTLRAWEQGTKPPRYYRHVLSLIAAGVDESLLQAATAMEVA